MAEGWIKLHRQLIDSEWFTDVNTNHLFTYCLIRANHKDSKWQGIDIKRGQFITSLDSLSKATGLTVRQIRTSLKKLIATSNMTSQSTNKYRLITVTNYHQYQDDDRQVDKPATSQRQTDDKPATTDKNNNNKKNEKNEINIPSWMPLDDWNDFLEMRKKQRSPPTDRAKQMLINKLNDFMVDGHNPAEVLQQSVMNNYKGLFEVKQNGKQFNNKQPTAHSNFTQGIALALSELNEQQQY